MRTFVVASGTSFIALGAIFAEGVIVAKALGPEGRGEISMYVAAFTLLFPIATIGVKQATAYAVGKLGYPYRYVRDVQHFYYPISLAALLGSLGLIYWWLGLLSKGAVVALAFTVFAGRILVDYACGFAIGVGRVQLQYNTELLRALISLALVAGLAAASELSVPTYFGGQVVAQLASVAYVLWWRRTIREELSVRGGLSGTGMTRWEFGRRGLSYAVPLFVMGLNYMVDILILGKLNGEVAVGFYAVAVTVAGLTWLAPNVLASVLFSKVVSISADEEASLQAEILRRLRVVMLAMGLIVLALGAGAEYLVEGLYGKAFGPAVGAIYWLLPGMYAMVLFKVLNSELSARGLTHLAVYIFSVAAALNVVLNLLWIPSYSQYGAAMATAVSYTLGAITYTVMYLRRWRQGTIAESARR